MASRAARISALALAAMLVASASTTSAPAASAEPIHPIDGYRATFLSRQPTHPNFEFLSRDGSRIVFRASYDPVTNQNVASDLWSHRAGRYTELQVGSAFFQDATADGSHVVVRSGAPWAPGDTDQMTDLYLVGPSSRELMTPGTAASSPLLRFLSEDGSVAVVETSESLDPADTDMQDDLYRWDRDSGDLTFITPGLTDPEFHAGTPDGGHLIIVQYWTYYEFVDDALVSRAVSIGPPRFSHDGDRLYFMSSDALVAEDVDGAGDVYWSDADGDRHLLTGSIDQPVGLSQASVDDTKFLLDTDAQLTASDTDINSDLYLLDDGELTLITLGVLPARLQAANDDLSRIVYSTWSPIDPTDPMDDNDLYLWSAADPDDPTLLTTGEGGDNGADVLHMSPDGERFIFTTDDGAAGNIEDVFAYEDGETDLLTPGGWAISFIGASEDGRRILFETNERLVTEDDDGSGPRLYILDHDLVGPEIDVDLDPADATQQDVEITFEAVNDDAILFDCALDGEVITPCSSPVELADLSAGPHTFEVTAWDTADNDTTESVSWNVVLPPQPDQTPPTGSIVIAGGAAATATSTVSLAVPATDAGSGVSQVALSNDNATWTARPYAPSQVWTVAGGTGSKTVYVTWRDGAGNWSPVASDSILLDTTPPTATAPRRGFVVGSTLASGRIMTRIPWSGGDVGSGIARYELQQQTDGGAWVQVWSGNYTAVNRSLATEHTFRLRVRAIDVAGNVSPWATGETFRVSRFNEHNAAVRYTGTWGQINDVQSLNGGHVLSTKAGATAKLTFTGRSIGWIAPSGSGRGKAEVYVNGSKVATVDLGAFAGASQRVVWVGSWTTSASRTITIKVLGTSGRPQVELDAFVTAN